MTGDPSPDSRKWLLLCAMSFVLGIVVLDETIVGVALPTIDKDLDLSVNEGHWIVNAYLLVFAALAAAGGRLGDILGRLPLFLLGVAIFGLSSFAAGFAPSGGWLIAARAIQGVGAAIVFPASLAMITHTFPPEQRGMAIGIYGGVGTSFLAIGPFAGGFFSEYVSWQWIFWINPVIAVAIGILTAIAWRDPGHDDAQPGFDVKGFVTLTLGLSLTVYALMQSTVSGWTDPVIWLCLAVGIVSLIAFVLVELREDTPLIDVALFANRDFTTYNLVVFVAQFGKIGVFVFIAITLQDTFGFSALNAGFVILAGAVPTVFTSPPAGIILERVGARALLVPAAALSGLSASALAASVAMQSLVLMIPALIIWSAAISFLFVPALRDVMSAVPPQKRGEAGGISMSSQLIGGVVGMTVASLLVISTGSTWPVFIAMTALYVLILALCLLLPRDQPATA